MLFQSFKASLVLTIATVASAHFTLYYPSAIGPYNDTLEATGPCDSYDPTKVTDDQFQNWPWQGQAVDVITTHPHVWWNFSVALFSEVTNDQSHFIPMTEDLQQFNGTGEFCFGQVPGKKEWVGRKAIVQMLMHAPDGILSTCIAAIFTDDVPNNGAPNCRNNSGPAHLPYSIEWTAGTGSDLNVQSSSPASSSSSPAPPPPKSSSSSPTITSTSSSSTNSGASTTGSGSAGSSTGSSGSGAGASGTNTGSSTPTSTSSSAGSDTGSSSQGSGTGSGGDSSGSCGSCSSGGTGTTNSSAKGTKAPTQYTGSAAKVELWSTVSWGLALVAFIGVGV